MKEHCGLFNLKNIIKHTRWMKDNIGEIDVPVVNHCNLNCAFCDHFSPLAKPYFLDIETYKNVLNRLKMILNGKKIYRFNLMGGEPLLHPQLLELCEFIKEQFTTSDIFITTNGILLNEFKWKKELDRLKVRIFVSKYGKEKKFYKLNLKEKKCENDNYKYCNNSNINVLDIKKNVDESYFDFYSDFPCNQLNENGDYFSCIIPANIKIFEEFFHKKYELIEGKDFINIFKIDNIESILFMNSCKKIPFCDYCGKKIIVNWKKTNYDEKEWLEC
jgi:organic radical activating enzyme